VTQKNGIAPGQESDPHQNTECRPSVPSGPDISPQLGAHARDELARSARLAAALDAAANHWQVGPLCKRDRSTGRILHPYGKDPVGRLVPHGVLDFTTDLSTIRKWWSVNPWNIGVRIPESMFVLDVDGPDRCPHPGKGLQALAELEDSYGPLPATFTQITGSGGLHLFYRRPPGKLSKARLPGGLEFKDHGGYVVLAPSTHPDTGETYVLGDSDEVASPPAWLIALLVDRPRPSVDRPPRTSCMAAGGPSIADSYSAAVSWSDVLEPHGWRCLAGDPDGDGARWLHPTATSAVSATVRHGCLFVYSSNTPFAVTEPSRPHGYTKFRAYAVLNHGADLRAAARALRGPANA
jgi:hypothetical protein